MLQSVRLRTLLVLICFFISGVSAFAEPVPRMSTDELNQRLGQADLVVLDVRGSWDWGPATEKITGAVRAEPRALGQWLNDYPKEKTIVLYCD